MKEYRIISDGIETSTRDETVADDAHCRGCTVRYREHGPYDESPGPWRSYASGAFAED